MENKFLTCDEAFKLVEEKGASIAVFEFDLMESEIPGVFYGSDDIVFDKDELNKYLQSSHLYEAECDCDFEDYQLTDEEYLQAISELSNEELNDYIKSVSLELSYLIKESTKRKQEHLSDSFDKKYQDFKSSEIGSKVSDLFKTNLNKILTLKDDLEKKAKDQKTKSQQGQQNQQSQQDHQNQNQKTQTDKEIEKQIDEFLNKFFK